MTEITRDHARELFERGRTIRVVPCKMGPENAWGAWFDVRKLSPQSDFARAVATFERYHCCEKTGLQAAFYAAQAA